MADIKLIQTTSKNILNNDKSECKMEIKLLDFYKKKCEILEKDLFKSQTQIKKLELSMRKSQEILTKNACNTNNTSISFFLPSEFKLNWENFLKDQIMESFENIYDDYIWLTHIVQDTFSKTYKHTSLLIQNKLKSILEILNLKDNSTDNFLNRFRSLFQDYFQVIFVFSEDFLNLVKNDVLICIEKYKDCERKNDVKKDINSKYYDILIQSLFKLSIYMLLHDPLINLNVEDYETRKIEYHYFNKNSFLSVEGFGKDRTPCAVILNPPIFKNKFIFQGIKPAIYCLSSEINEHVIQECELNDKVKIHNNEKNLDKDFNPLTNINEINNESRSRKSNLPSQNISVLDDEPRILDMKLESKLLYNRGPDLFETHIKADSNDIHLEPINSGILVSSTEIKNSTLQNTFTNIDKDYINYMSEVQKRSNSRSNSELMKNEQSINDCENDISYSSNEDVKKENTNIKTVNKLIYSSNFENHNFIDNTNDIAVLIKKKNINFANNFLDSFNKNNINNIKTNVQNKSKNNSTNSSNLKINNKVFKNNYFQSNRDNISFKTKQTGFSQDNHKKKDSSVNKIFEKYRQKGLVSSDLATNTNFSKTNTAFGAAKESTHVNFFTKSTEKNITNSPKFLNNFMKMKSVMTMKNSIKNAYIEYINSKALNKNTSNQQKLNLNSSNPSLQNGNPQTTIKNTLNANSININIPQTNNYRNDKNLLIKNLTDKTNSKHDNNGNDLDYILNSENVVDFSNRNHNELNSKTPIENMTYIEKNQKTCDIRLSLGYKRDKEGFYNTNYNYSKRENLPKDEHFSHNSTIENFIKNDKKSNISPKSDIKTNLLLSKDHSLISYDKSKNKGIEQLRTSKPLMFKNQKSIKKSNKII